MWRSLAATAYWTAFLVLLPSREAFAEAPLVKFSAPQNKTEASCPRELRPRVEAAARALQASIDSNDAKLIAPYLGDFNEFGTTPESVLNLFKGAPRGAFTASYLPANDKYKKPQQVYLQKDGTRKYCEFVVVAQKLVIRHCDESPLEGD